MHERLPTAEQITTTWVTCSNRNLPSYIPGPEIQIKVSRLLPEALGQDPPTPRQLLGVQGLLQLWSHPPNLCCVVTQPLTAVSSPVSLTRAVAVGSGGHPGDSGQPQLEIRNCLPLSKDPFFQMQSRSKVPVLRKCTHLWGPPLNPL